ncbi:PUA domain-containing protein [Staphylotrichum tortipilum]|uniref:PUA domain-containing protein n=1 Tax=Staphylotrichum tortipilum TaxID=2831512 RepID=A0AAN6RY09_9PEZI|nr:PUA domain-containing protein [Staphylotrichum longicolle]
MPLVVPGVTIDNMGGDKTQEWMNKLAGKLLCDGPSTETTFCKTDLPQTTRVIEPGMMVTRDFNPDRLNVHVGKDGIVSHPPPTSLHGSPKQKLKSSIQRSIRNSILSTYPLITPHIDEVLPKKSSLELVKLPDRVSLYVIDGHPIVYQQDNNGVLLPHLKLVHRFPQCFPTIRIDRGAIRFVLSGATLMAPGLTSPGGRLPIPVPNEGVDEDGHWSRELEKGEPVVVMAEGKEEAAAVGVLVMGTKDIKEKGKGPVMEEAHYLGDGLWRLSVE